MVNPQRPLRDSYYFLTDVIKEIQTTRLNKSFADVFDDNDYPNFNNPRHVLAYASTITSEDTDTMVLMRLWLYYVLIHKARDLHPTMFVIPEDNFHDSISFKPQVQLLFVEKNITAAQANRRPVRAEISFRLPYLVPQYVTDEYVDELAQKIWDVLVLPSPYSFTKGTLIGNYRDLDNGYQMRILADSEQTLRNVITKVLNIRELEMSDEFFSISQSRRTFPTPDETVPILGTEYSKPVQRPTVNVSFVRAELKLLGMRVSKILVSRFDYCDSQCSRIF